MAHGWDLLGCIDYNFGEDGYPREEVHAFIVDASSSFYSEFGQAITEEVDRWLDKKHANNPPQREDEEAGAMRPQVRLLQKGLVRRSGGQISTYTAASFLIVSGYRSTK
jgi:hypothetical protein